MLQDLLRVYRFLKHIVFVKNLSRSLVTEQCEHDHRYTEMKMTYAICYSDSDNGNDRVNDY